MRKIITCPHMYNFYHYEIARKTFICGEFVQEKVLKNYDVMVNIFDFKAYNESMYLAFHKYSIIKYTFYHDGKKYILNDENSDTIIKSNNFMEIVSYLSANEPNIIPSQLNFM